MLYSLGSDIVNGTFEESSDILAAIAPRASKVCYALGGDCFVRVCLVV
jgi:hypothetical protein